jgi:hypothetical protein
VCAIAKISPLLRIICPSQAQKTDKIFNPTKGKQKTSVDNMKAMNRHTCVHDPTLESAAISVGS